MLVQSTLKQLLTSHVLTEAVHTHDIRELRPVTSTSVGGLQVTLANKGNGYFQVHWPMVLALILKAGCDISCLRS